MTIAATKDLSMQLLAAVRDLIEFRESMERQNADFVKGQPRPSSGMRGLYTLSELAALWEVLPSAAGEDVRREKIRDIGQRLFDVGGTVAMEDACDRCWDEPGLGGYGVDIVAKAWDGIGGWMA